MKSMFDPVTGDLDAQGVRGLADSLTGVVAVLCDTFDFLHDYHDHLAANGADKRELGVVMARIDGVRIARAVATRERDIILHLARVEQRGGAA